MTQPDYTPQHQHDGPALLVCSICAAVISRDLETVEPYDAGLRRHTRWHASLQPTDHGNETPDQPGPTAPDEALAYRAGRHEASLRNPRSYDEWVQAGRPDPDAPIGSRTTTP